MRLSLLCAALAAVACNLTYRPVVVAPKTELETQILGSFERLQSELPLSAPSVELAEVRALSPQQRGVLQAMLDRELNRSDVALAKREQLVGEANNGLLAIRSRPAAPAASRKLERLVEWENRARATIMKGVILLDDDLSAGDLAAVRAVFHRLEVRASADGDLIQDASGAWRAK